MAIKKFLRIYKKERLETTIPVNVSIFWSAEKLSSPSDQQGHKYHPIDGYCFLATFDRDEGKMIESNSWAELRVVQKLRSPVSKIMPLNDISEKELSSVYENYLNMADVSNTYQRHSLDLDRVNGSLTQSRCNINLHSIKMKTKTDICCDVHVVSLVQFDGYIKLLYFVFSGVLQIKYPLCESHNVHSLLGLSPCVYCNLSCAYSWMAMWSHCSMIIFYEQMSGLDRKKSYLDTVQSIDI